MSLIVGFRPALNKYLGYIYCLKKFLENVYPIRMKVCFMLLFLKAGSGEARTPPTTPNLIEPLPPLFQRACFMFNLVPLINQEVKFDTCCIKSR